MTELSGTSAEATGKLDEIYEVVQQIRGELSDASTAAAVAAPTAATSPARASTATDASSPAAPEPPAAEKRQKRPRGGFAKWRARLFVLVMMGGAVAGGQKIVAAKTAASAQLDLGTVTLTAQPVQVQPPVAGQVTQVEVHALQRVAAGRRLGTLRTTQTTATGKTVNKTVTITAPTAGVVSDDPAVVGSTVQPGQAFAVLYDPAELRLLARVPQSEISRLSPGMSATLRTGGLAKPVHAVVREIRPWVGTGSSGVSPNRLEVILVAKDPADVSGLLPGVRFTGTVDTRSGPKNALGGETLVSR